MPKNQSASTYGYNSHNNQVSEFNWACCDIQEWFLEIIWNMAVLLVTAYFSLSDLWERMVASYNEIQNSMYGPVTRFDVPKKKILDYVIELFFGIFFLIFIYSACLLTIIAEAIESGSTVLANKVKIDPLSRNLHVAGEVHYRGSVEKSAPKKENRIVKWIFDKISRFIRKD